MPIDVVGGLLAGVGLLTAVVLGRFILAYASADGDDELATAFAQTGRWAYGTAGAAAGVVGLGIVEFGDILGQMFGFIAGHPYFASNLGIVGLGAGALSGVFALTASQYIGVAIAILGAVLLVVEVDSNAA